MPQAPGDETNQSLHLKKLALAISRFSNSVRVQQSHESPCRLRIVTWGFPGAFSVVIFICTSLLRAVHEPFYLKGQYVATLWAGSMDHLVDAVAGQE